MLERLKFWRSNPSLTLESPFFLDNPDFVEHPYPFYEELRRNHPFYRGPDGQIILSRHSDISEALRHPSLGNRPSRFSTLHSSKAEQHPCARIANSIIPFQDGQEHAEQRRLVGRLFTECFRDLEKELPALSKHFTANLPQELNVLPDLATPFSRQCIHRLLGFPSDSKLEKWSEDFFYLFIQMPSAEVRERVNQSLLEFQQWTLDLLQQPDAKGLTASFQASVAKRELTAEVAANNLILLFADGLENVDTGIANALYCFSQNPDQWERLRENPNLAPSAARECLRYESSAQFIGRTVLEGFEWQGHSLKKDFQILLLLGSANRDSDIFPRADQFIIDRHPNPFLSFGAGKHSCLGGRMVEKQITALLVALVSNHKSLTPTSQVKWRNRKGHRWPCEIRLKLEPN